jgi:hypothetical protein
MNSSTSSSNSNGSNHGHHGHGHGGTLIWIQYVRTTNTTLGDVYGTRLFEVHTTTHDPQRPHLGEVVMHTLHRLCDGMCVCLSVYNLIRFLLL